MKTQFFLLKIAFSIFVSQNLIVFLRADEILFAQEYDNTSPINDYKQMICNCGFWFEYNTEYIIGQYDSTSNSNPIIRTYFSLPPHWSIAFSFDLILFNINNWKSQDKLQISVDNNVLTSYQKESINPSLSFCTSSTYDTLKFYHINVTHSSPFVQLQIKSNFVPSASSYGIRNIILHVETCHQSCLTCNGPTSDNCLSCPNNFSLVGNTCKCAVGYFQYQNTCLQLCPQGYNQNQINSKCEYDNCNTLNCQTCNSSPKRQCLTCKPGFYLHIDQCVSSCPPYAPLTNNICQDPISSLKNGKYALRGLFSQTFGESEIKGMNLLTQNFYGNGLENNNPSNQVFTNCGGVQLFGGANLAATQSKIIWRSSNLVPHYQLTISFKAYILDSWDSENFYLQIDNNTIFQVNEDFNNFSTQLCGLSEYNDQIETIYQTIAHSSPTIEVIISSNLDENPYNESFGIRELYILLEACIDNCQQCNDSITCQKCMPGYGLYNSKCYQPCPDSFWNNQGICTACDSSCLNCSGSSSSQCTSCKPGTFLYNNTCVKSCPDIQYYPDTQNNICKPCDASCQKCQSPGDNKSCTQCQPTFLLNGQCLSNCPDQYYKSGNVCKPCDSTCLTCSGPNPNQCLTCLPPNKLQTKDNTCSLTCPDTDQYLDSNKCINCDSTCASCSAAGANACTKCKTPLFLNTNKCVPTCPSGQFANLSDLTCKPCDSNCLTCSNSSIQCLTCQQPLKFQPKTKQCVNSCDDNQYFDSVSNQCLSCDPNCKGCINSSTQCISCNPPNFLKLSMCTSDCGQNQYGDSTDQKCKPCDPTCLTCSGPNGNQCITCVPPLILYQAEKQCKQACRNDQYFDKASNSCIQCNQDCQQCSGPNNNQCLSCNPPKILQGTQCQGSCDNGFYANTNNICLPCDPNCQTCVNSSTECITCPSGKLLDTVSKKCVSQCQDVQYQDLQNKACKPCNIQCKTCQGPLDSDCLSCSPPFVLQGTNCQQKCNDGFFYSQTDQKCMICDQNCQTCSVSSKQCTTCPTNQYLDIVSKTCVSKCSDNSYLDSSNNSCFPCNASCKTCSGPSSIECLSCNPPNVLQINKCQSECDQSYFYSSIDQKCMKCDQNCNTCENKSTECLTCPPTKLLDSVTKSCVSNCAQNEYQDIPSMSCKVCDKTCKTCSGPTPQNCLTCESSFQLINGKCVPICTVGFFQDKDFTCKPCDPSCTSCNLSSSNCQTCKSPFILNKQQCVANCNSDQYIDITKNECAQCNSQCQACTGPSNNQCTSCPQGKFLNGSACFDTCQEKQYTENNVCKNCNQTCESCTGEQNNQCTKCSKGSYLYKNMCISQCPEDLFQDQTKNECAKCHESCQNNGCYGPGMDQCKTQNLDYKRSLIVMIVTGKTIFWLVSCIIGFILDRKDKRIYSNKVQSINEEQINESPRDLENKQELKQEEEFLENPQNEFTRRRKRQKFLQSQINSLNVNSANITKEQTQAQNSQINSHNISTYRTRRARSKIAILLSQANTFQDLSQNNLDQNSQAVTDFTPSLKKLGSKSNMANEQESPFCTQVQLEESKQKDQFYQCNQKLKYTFIGSELISLFKLYDPQISRIFRSTLIYIKYLAFLFATEFVFYQGNIILLIPSIFFGITVKFLLYQILTSLNIFLRYGAVIASLILIGASVSDIYLWFLPIIKNLYWNKDFTWSVFYAAVFSVDLIVIQQIISLFKYLSSVRSLNVKKELWQNILNKLLTSRALILNIKKN